MNFYKKAEAVRRINWLGAKGQPFLFIIDYKQESVFVEEPGNIDSDEILYNLNGFTNVFAGLANGAENVFSSSIKWEVEPVPFSTYEKAFCKIHDQIHAGNSYLVNLTCATPVNTKFSLLQLYHCSIARYKLWMKDRFVVFSPEIFVRIINGIIYSYPMKGTVDATLPDAADLILNDPKEVAEHATIVDLIRNDLSKVASQVSVSRYRYLEELQTNKGSLLQVSSEVRGQLSEDWVAHLGTILFDLLPAGSVTGAPKRKTMEIIADAETCERGFYTGVMGYFDGQKLDSGVMIRFVEQQGDQLFFKSGGGITSQSDLLSEYNEMNQKIYVPIC